MSFKRICAALIIIPPAVILIAFMIANRTAAALNLNIFAALFGKSPAAYSFTAPLFVWLFLFLLAGALLGRLIMLPKLCADKRRTAALLRENARLQAELAARAEPKQAEAKSAE